MVCQSGILELLSRAKVTFISDGKGNLSGVPGGKFPEDIFQDYRSHAISAVIPSGEIRQFIEDSNGCSLNVSPQGFGSNSLRGSH